MKQTMIAIGNFFFKWRNYLFPVFVVALFAFKAPVEVSPQLEILSILFVFAGLAMRATVIGFAYIKRGGMNKKVYADKLVTQGMFELCRNPLYVGNMLAIIGIFLMHGDPIVIAIGITVYAFIYQCIIYAEEAYLQKKFGKSFAAYCKKTPRWLPVIHRFNTATQKMAFGWKRVLVKDYTTIATNTGALAIIAYYRTPSPLLAVFLVACILFISVVNMAKKKGILKAA